MSFAIVITSLLIKLVLNNLYRMSKKILILPLKLSWLCFPGVFDRYNHKYKYD
jgi:hypothetical protein